MSTITDPILQRFYNTVRNRIMVISILVFVVSLSIGYITSEPMVLNLVALACIIVLYLYLFLLKQKIAHGSFPETIREKDDLDRWFRSKGGRIVRGVSID